MMDDLEKQGWPVSPADINLLEKEIQQAQTFLLQSQDLRKKSEEVTSCNYSYGKKSWWPRKLEQFSNDCRK